MNELRSVLKKIGHNFRIERLKQSLSQEKFAEIAEVHTNYIGKIERGEQNLTVKSIVELSNALKVPVENILNIHE